MDVSLKHKVKSDYKTEADIPWEFIGREGGDADKKRSRNTRTCFGGSHVRELGL